MYVYIYIYTYTYTYTCKYIYIYIYINLPHFIRTPLIRNPPLGKYMFVYYQFRRRHDFPPHEIPPPSEANIVTVNLDGGTINLDGSNDVIC